MEETADDLETQPIPLSEDNAAEHVEREDSSTQPQNVRHAIR